MLISSVGLQCSLIFRPNEPRMGLKFFIDVVVSLFSGDRELLEPRSQKTTASTPESGQLCRATVTVVKDRFAILTNGNTELLVFIGEIADRRLEAVSEVLSVGQVVEVVLLEESDRRPGQWIASIRAAAVLIDRQLLSTFKVGERHLATVSGFVPKGAQVKIDEIEFFVPNAEIAWRPIDAPSQILEIGQDIEVQILKVVVPAWSRDWKKQKVTAIASIRNCIDRPVPTFVPMAFSAVPFRLEVDIKKPSFLDPVLMHVLTELVHGHQLEEIAQRTRLPMVTLQAMVDVLSREGLLVDMSPASRARSLVSAAELARSINSNRLGALFMPMAEPGSQVAMRDGTVVHPPVDFPHPIPPYPSTWPPPVWHVGRGEKFLRSSGDDIPTEVMTWCLGKEQGETLLAHQADQRLRVRVVQDSEEGANQPICTFVRDHWLFGALWRKFDPAGENKPYRPVDEEDTAPVLLLVRLVAKCGKEELPRPVYLEPYTNTYWIPRSGDWRGGVKMKGSSFPVLPPVGEHGWTLGDGQRVTKLEPARWESVSFERRS